MNREKKMTKRDVLARVKGLDDGEQKAVVCALVGHSHVVEMCFGQVTCARCGAVVGDTLMGAMSLDSHVLVGHACETCHTNYGKLGWRDTLMTPNPFPAPKESPDAVR